MAKSNYDNAVFFLWYKQRSTHGCTSVTALVIVDVHPLHTHGRTVPPCSRGRTYRQNSLIYSIPCVKMRQQITHRRFTETEGAELWERSTSSRPTPAVQSLRVQTKDSRQPKKRGDNRAYDTASNKSVLSLLRTFCFDDDAYHGQVETSKSRAQRLSRSALFRSCHQGV